jgi:predicted small secreted protein
MKYYMIVVMIALLPLLAGCNTMEGAGQDIQKGGKAIENSADKNK